MSICSFILLVRYAVLDSVVNKTHKVIGTIYNRGQASDHMAEKVTIFLDIVEMEKQVTEP